MITFRCPRCNSTNSVQANQAGAKIECVNMQCRQRLQVPKAPPPNKTVLGVLDADMGSGMGIQSHLPPSNATLPPGDKTEYWLRRDANMSGPYTLDYLRELIKRKKVVATDDIWVPSSQTWIPAKNVKVFQNKGNVTLPGGRGGAPSAGNALLIGGSVAAVVLVILCISAGVYFGTRGRNKLKTEEVVEKTGAPEPIVEKTEPVREPKKDENAELSPEEIVNIREKSVALIKGKYGAFIGSGTGFLVRPGILATNYHVIERTHADHLSVFFPSAGEQGKKPLGVDKVLFYDRDLDLALISLKSPLPSHPPLPLAPNYRFKRAQNIVVIGNPGLGGDVPNLENAVSRGITSTEVVMEGVNTYQLDITVNPGNSGGPVLDGRGKVIGVIKSKASKQERLSFCIPVNEVETAIAKVEKLSPTERDKITSTFNARVILRRIYWSAEISFIGTTYVDKAWEDAIKAKMPVNPAFLAGQNLFKKTLNPFPRGVWDHQDVADYIAKVGTDPMLSEATRQDFASLWQAHEALSNNFRGFNGTLNNYLMENHNNRKRSTDLVNKMRITLGFTEKELLIPPG